METRELSIEEQNRIVNATLYGETDPIETLEVEAPTGTSLAEIEALLGDLEVPDEIVEEAAPVAEALDAEEQILGDALLGDALRELDIAEAKAEAYAEQVAPEGEDMNTELPEPVATATAAEVAAKEEKPKRKRESSEGKKKSEIITSHLGAESAGFFALEIDDAELDVAELKEREKATLEVIDALPKKVGEKATNLFDFLKTGEHLSVYTKIAFDLLLEKSTFTSEDLRAAMLAHGYTVGTSSSQAQQMMTLLPALKVGVRVKNIMTKNPESMILAKYEATKAASAA